MSNTKARHINIVVPMAGAGTPFKNAGYAFPKPIIDIRGKTMIEVVIANLRPKSADHTFIFVCQKDHYEKFDLYNIFKRATNNKFEAVQLNGRTEGAACTVLAAFPHIASADDLIIANSDQVVDISIDNVIKAGRAKDADGLILTFESSHPKWSYVRSDKKNHVIETAEKKVISNLATAGIYYFRHGTDFAEAAQSMIQKNIRYNNEFYVCPVYNELILLGKNILHKKIDAKAMHGLGTPEELALFLQRIDQGHIRLPA